MRARASDLGLGDGVAGHFGFLDHLQLANYDSV